MHLAPFRTLEPEVLARIKALALECVRRKPRQLLNLRLFRTGLRDALEPA